MNKPIFYNLFWIAGLAWLLSGCAGAPVSPMTISRGTRKGS